MFFDIEYQKIDLMESLNIWHNDLLNSIGAIESDIFDTLKLPKDFYQGKLDINYLGDNIEFINSLASIALKKSQIYNTDDYECFLNKPCKFMFIYGVESNELENPMYILFQTWNDTLKKWSDAQLYKINDDVKKFYDKLSSKTIEIIDNGENYIYTSANANEWVLQNSEKENDIYKKVFRKDDLQVLLNNREVKLKIV